MTSSEPKAGEAHFDISFPKRPFVIMGIFSSVITGALSWMQPNDFRAATWGACGLFILAFLATLAFSRVRVAGNTLTVDNVVYRRSVRLDELTSVAASQDGKKRKVWQVALSDRSGGQAALRLNGFPAAERRRVLMHMMKFIENSDAEQSGPIAWVVRENPWTPSA